MPRLRTLLNQRESVLLMGGLNRTPDSLSDGGEAYGDVVADVARECRAPRDAALGGRERHA
jgi:dihydropteroate synthase